MTAISTYLWQQPIAGPAAALAAAIAATFADPVLVFRHHGPEVRP